MGLLELGNLGSNPGPATHQPCDLRRVLYPPSLSFLNGDESNQATNWVSMKIEGGTRGKCSDAPGSGCPILLLSCVVKLLAHKLSECLIYLTSFFLDLRLDPVAHTLWAVNQYSWNELISK